LIGPYCLGVIPTTVIEGTEFLSDVAVAFIAFSTGEFFKLNVLRQNGVKVVVITIFEAITASAVIFTVMYFILRLSLVFSIVLAALASATASTSTMMTIRQMRAKGDFVNTLLQVVAIDNIVALIAYSIAISLALALSGDGIVNLGDIVKPVFINIGVMILGGLFGLILKLLIHTKRSTDNRLIITIAILFAFCGVCAVLDVSPLLGCMAMGTVYTNITDDEKLFKQINYFSPPIMLLFFVRSGLTFRMDALIEPSGLVGTVPLLAVSLIYFVVRIAAKYAGAFIGCASVRKPKEVRNYLGLALIPQAGVAIGLASLGARALGGETGDALQTIILASSILYELVGPACAKLSLYLSGAYSDNIDDIVSVAEVDEAGRKKNDVEMLIERIQAIQKEFPPHMESEEEIAFTKAAEEHIESLNAYRFMKMNRR